MAGKVTVGLALHWPRVTDISGSPPTGSRPRKGSFVCLFAWGLTALSAQIGYIVP